MTTVIKYPHPEILEDLRELRRWNPLTQCITNIVVTNFTANVLLSIGASPAMVIAEEESSEFARIAGALLINIGTITASEERSVLKAAQAATEAGTPWVLDPVGSGATKFRTKVIY